MRIVRFLFVLRSVRSLLGELQGLLLSGDQYGVC